MEQEIKCRIVIDKNISHNILKGTVQFRSRRELVIVHAIIEITGTVFTKWKLERTRIKIPHIYTKGRVMEGTEQFYFSRHTLCGGEISQIHDDDLVYKFECYWPSRLPGSWIGDHGCIRYGHTKILHLQTTIIQRKFSQEMYVKGMRDLTLEQHLNFESRIDVKRNFFTTKPMGPVWISLWIPISGVRAGQTLPVLCTVLNLSRLHFGTLNFVLTRKDMYKSKTPFVAVKTIKTDICRVAKMVNVHTGKYDYFSTLKVNADAIPTNEFFNCTTCRTTYEVWASLQCVYPRYRILGYPNIDTPGLPLVVGTTSLYEYNVNRIAAEIFKTLFTIQRVIEVEHIPVDERMKKIIDESEEELNKQIERNLERHFSVTAPTTVKIGDC